MMGRMRAVLLRQAGVGVGAGLGMHILVASPTTLRLVVQKSGY